MFCKEPDAHPANQSNTTNEGNLTNHSTASRLRSHHISLTSPTTIKRETESAGCEEEIAGWNPDSRQLLDKVSISFPTFFCGR